MKLGVILYELIKVSNIVEPEFMIKSIFNIRKIGIWKNNYRKKGISKNQ